MSSATAKGPVSPAGTTISMPQYNRGLEMFEGGATLAAISVAIGLSEHEVSWLIQKGDDARDMPRWSAVVAERSANRRRHQLTISESIALGAATMIDNAQQIAVSAQGYIKAVMGAYLMQSAKPALVAIERGRAAGETDQAWEDRRAVLLGQLALPKDIVASLKIMKDLADIEAPARAYAQVYLNARSSRNNGLADTLRGFTGKIEMGAAAVLPAQVSGVEKMPGAEQGVADPLDVDPEFRGMSLAEIAEYDATGVMPDRVFGSDEPVSEWPEGVDFDLDPNA